MSLTGRQSAVLHTYSGTQLYQWTTDLIDLSWSRESREVSRCQLTVPSTIDNDKIPDIVPWLHWVSVWDDSGQDLYWRGPVQKPSFNRQKMTIPANDMAVLFKRTRCPLTKRWEVTDPADIAGELLSAMVEHHNLNVKPRVRYDPFGDKFDYQATADAVMLDANIDELVQLGLHWTVMAGVPLLGPQPRTAVAALSEDDFIGGDGVTITRDGTNTFNDVLLRGGDSLARAKVPMGGLNLQTIVNVDNMFGVSNTDRATRQYARYVSRIHDTITFPDNAVFHPDAPVDFWQLIPSARFTMEAYGLLLPVELTGIDVTCTPEGTATSARIASVDDELPELITLQKKTSISEFT